MKAGGVGTVRWPIGWPSVQPTAKRRYDWGSVDPAVEAAARHGLTILPFLYGTPRWLAAQANDAADRQRQGTQGLGGLRQGGGKTLRARRGILGGTRSSRRGRQLRAGDPAADADPHLAGLERGQLLLLRLPGLAKPLRAPC